MALGVVACRLPGRVERDGARRRAHGRAVPDAARTRMLAGVLGYGTLTVLTAVAATSASGRLPRRRWRGRGGLVW